MIAILSVICRRFREGGKRVAAKKRVEFLNSFFLFFFYFLFWGVWGCLGVFLHLWMIFHKGIVFVAVFEDFLGKSHCTGCHIGDRGAAHRAFALCIYASSG